MGGPAPDRAALTDPDAPRRLAKARIAVGVPALLVVAAGLFLVWRIKGGIAAAVVAGFAVPVGVVFGVYFALAWRRLRRPPPPNPGGPGGGEEWP